VYALSHDEGEFAVVKELLVRKDVKPIGKLR
jgi:hypothetical protein